MWGIDRLSSGQQSAVRKRLRNGSCAVLSHAAATDRKGRGILAVLDDLGVTPSVIFSPEHGFGGWAQAEESVESELGASGDGPAVISLYGKDKHSLAPRDEQLEGIDTLLIDLVDVGSRYYTYAWTALLSARKAAARGVHTIVLDRPNPIGGDPNSAEGKPQHEGYLSFVGLEPVCIRHGLSIGELLTQFLTRDGLTPGPEGAFSVVGCQGWERLRLADAWNRPFIPPSPNMPTLETALLYPGACLIEGTNLSEGRGTSFPFRVVGAPFLDGAGLANTLNDALLPGVLFRPVTFRPSFEKHAGQSCKGVMLHVTNPWVFRPVTTYLTLLRAARAQNPDAFAFLTRAYEFETEIPAFDLLTGSSEARQALLADASANDVVELISPVGDAAREMHEFVSEHFPKACT